MTTNVGFVAGAQSEANSQSRVRKSSAVRLAISAVLLLAAAASPALVGSNHFKSICVEAWGPSRTDRTGLPGFLDRLPDRTAAALLWFYGLTLIVAASACFLSLSSLVKSKVRVPVRADMAAPVPWMKRARSWVTNNARGCANLAVTYGAAIADWWKTLPLRARANVAVDRWTNSKAGVWAATEVFPRWDVTRSWVASAANLKAFIYSVPNSWRANQKRLATLGIVLPAGIVAIVVFQSDAFNRHGWDLPTDLARASVLVTLAFTVAVFAEIFTNPQVVQAGRWPVPQLAGVVATAIGLALIVMAFRTSNRNFIVWGAELAAIMAAGAAWHADLQKGTNPPTGRTGIAVWCILLVATAAVWPVLFATETLALVPLAILGLMVVVDLCLKHVQRPRWTKVARLAGQITAGTILCGAAMVAVRAVIHLSRMVHAWRPVEVLRNWASGLFRSLNPTDKLVEPTAWLGRSMNPTFALVTSTVAAGLALALAAYWLWTVWPGHRKRSRGLDDRSYFGPTAMQTVLLCWLAALVAAVVYTQMMGGLTAGLYRSYRYADVVGPVLKTYPLVGKNPEAEFQAAKDRRGTFDQRVNGTFQQRVMYLVFARLGLLPPNRTFDRLYKDYSEHKEKFEQLLMFDAMGDNADGGPVGSPAYLAKPRLIANDGKPSFSGIELAVYLAMKVHTVQSTGETAETTYGKTTGLLAGYAADVGSVREELPKRVHEGKELPPPNDADFRIPGSYFFAQPLATGTEMVGLLSRQMEWTQENKQRSADPTQAATPASPSIGSTTAPSSVSTDKNSFATTQAAINYPASPLVWTDGPAGGLRPIDMHLQTLATSIARVLDELSADEAVKRYTYWINVVRGPEQLIITALFLFAMSLLAWRFVVGCWQARQARRVVRWIRNRDGELSTSARREQLLYELECDPLAAVGSLARHLVWATAAGELSVARSVVERTERRGLWVIVWITLSIPAVDFIGTVRGISEGLTYAEQIVRADSGPARAIAVTNVTSLLGLAFATTVTALSLLLLLTLFEKLVAAREASIVSKLCRALAHLTPKRRETETGESPRPQESSTNLMVNEQVLKTFKDSRKARDHDAVASPQRTNEIGDVVGPGGQDQGIGGIP